MKKLFIILASVIVVVALIIIISNPFYVTLSNATNNDVIKYICFGENVKKSWNIPFVIYKDKDFTKHVEGSA